MHQWSTTPLNNQTADSRANWQEGQPASSLNNSARGLMATAAFWRDDNLGVTLVAQAGTNNAYTLATGQGLIDPATQSSTPAITHAFSLRIAFSAAPTGMATNPLKIAIDGAASAPVTRADGSALVDGDIVTGRSYPIVGYAFTNGALSQIRVISVLPSETLAQINATVPGLLAALGSPVQKTGDTMTGDLTLSGAPGSTRSPQLHLLLNNVAGYKFRTLSSGRMQVCDFAESFEIFSVGYGGDISTRQFGDLSSRIEARGSAWADNAVLRANTYTNAFVQGCRWIYAGEKSCISQPGTGGFISPFGPQAMQCDFWSWAFTTADGQSGAAPFAIRYRNLQVYTPAQGWVTVGAVS